MLLQEGLDAELETHWNIEGRFEEAIEGKLPGARREIGFRDFMSQNALWS